jgi:hypothetical protein
MANFVPAFHPNHRADGAAAVSHFVVAERFDRTDWVKVPVPVFGFGTTINGIQVTSLSPQNDGGAFVFADAQQRKQGNLTELQFRLKHQRLALAAILWLRTFDDSAALEMGFVLRNESSEPIEVNGLDPLTLTLHPNQQVRLLTLTGGRYDDKFPPSSFALTEQTLQDGASVKISCGDEGRSSAKDIPWFALGLAAETGEILEGVVGGLEWSGRWRGLIQKQGNAVTVQVGATEGGSPTFTQLRNSLPLSLLVALHWRLG